MEEAFHRAVAAHLSGVGQDGEPGHRAPFAEAVAAMEAAPPEALGVFGSHWMLPWLRRCRDLGREAPL